MRCTAGGIYASIDRFRDDDRRMVSAVIYLNDAWLPRRGGQLRMYLKGRRREYDVVPTGIRLVVFLSGEVPREKSCPLRVACPDGVSRR